MLHKLFQRTCFNYLDIFRGEAYVIWPKEIEDSKLLRCTLSSLIPIINSKEYGSISVDMLNKHRSQFEHLVKHESYYILRELPIEILDKIFIPHIPEIMNKQNRNGTWKIRDGERISFDILKALEKCNRLPNLETDLKYDLFQNIRDKTDIYSVLLKDTFFHHKSENIKEEKKYWIDYICNSQKKDGSWYSTVIGTIVCIDQLLLFDFDRQNKSIINGVEYLFSNLNIIQHGDHVGKPYGFFANNMYTTSNRNKEFEVANSLKPEWIPRNICFRHLGVIQNSTCINLLLKLGYEEDQRVKLSLDNLVRIENDWGGFCDTNIKKVYVENHKRKKRAI